MPNDEPLAVVEPLSIVRVSSRSFMKRAVDQKAYGPRKKTGFQKLSKAAKLPCLAFGQFIQIVNRQSAMVSQQPAELGFMDTGKPRGLRESVFSSRNHQEKQIPGTDGLLPISDFQIFDYPFFEVGKGHIRLRGFGLISVRRRFYNKSKELVCPQKSVCA